MKTVIQYFKPEFINRIDEIVMFESLTKEDIKKIIDIQLTQVCSRVRESGIELIFTQAMKDRLVEFGYDPIYGARPLKRVIRQIIENPLAQAILTGQFNIKDTINVDIGNNGCIFSKMIHSKAIQ
jgi:ATP-dependent Clp protease ATP-binding subunit ClpB